MLAPKRGNRETWQNCSPRIQIIIGRAIITSVLICLPTHTKTEVVYVNRDAIWQAFAETGDVVYYLLYRAIDAEKTELDDTRGCAAD